MSPSRPNRNNGPFEESYAERQVQLERTAQLFAMAAATSRTYRGFILRPLLPSEVQTLQGPYCRCRCNDWSKIRLMFDAAAANADMSDRLMQQVESTTFSGIVVIGLDLSDSKSEDGLEQQLPAGIRSNSFISNCILEPGCRVYHNTLLCDTHVCANATVMHCGHVSSTGQLKGGRLAISLGAESGGGRIVPVTVESTMIDVCQSLRMARITKMTKQLLPQQQQGWKHNIVSPCALLSYTPTVNNVFLAPHSQVTAATSVVNAILLPKASIRNSCTVSSALLQWDASIADHSSVTNALLMEQAHVGPKSLVSSTILGPDSHVSCGELHSTILGPNTNSHHQSLLIGILWPLGRGNVGYGANVGSNHTGRLPDQETAAGEGTFWGLSCVVKFPVDLTWSPYSIVAAGVALIPQRVAMPFSLIVDAPDHGMNQILPGWVLSNSPYTIARSQDKFASRRKAKRHAHYTGWNIVRPDIIDMCIAARGALQSTGESSSEGVYKTDKDIMGIGKNCMTERARQMGITAYTKLIHRYALRGLFDRIQRLQKSGGNVESTLRAELFDQAGEIGGTWSARSLQDWLKQVSWPSLPWEEGVSTLWDHQRCVLQMELTTLTQISAVSAPIALAVELLHKLVQLENEYAQKVCHSKKRDDTRGAKTIPGYSESHIAAENDPTVKGVLEEARKLETEVDVTVGALARAPAVEARSRL